MDVGKILKPQGIRGEVKDEPLTDDPSRFCVLKTVEIEGKAMRISSARVQDGFVIIKFVGVDDRNAAELLRNKFISIDRTLAASLGDDEFYIVDLVGATLVARSQSGSTEVGTIERIESFGAADVFGCKTKDGKPFSFAFVKALRPEYDADSRTLFVDADKIREVAVYED